MEDFGEPGLDKGSAKIEETWRGHEPGPPTEALRRATMQIEFHAVAAYEVSMTTKPIMAEKA